MKKLPRQFVRKEDDPSHESEIWQPSWRCFCCHDSGEVNPHLARLVINGYEMGKDKIPRCQNLNCAAGAHFDNAAFKGMIDYRFTPEICQELDAIHREDWRKTTQMKAALIEQKVDVMAKEKSIRTCDRTPSELRSASQKHAAITAGWSLEAQNDEEREWLALRQYCSL